LPRVKIRLDGIAVLGHIHRVMQAIPEFNDAREVGFIPARITASLASFSIL